MSPEAKQKRAPMHGRMLRIRCWLTAMLAHFDDLLAAALEDMIMRGAGLRACHVKKRMVKG